MSEKENYPMDYLAYLRYKNVIELLTANRMTRREIIDNTKYPVAIVYKMIRNLLKFKIIKIVDTKLINDTMRTEKVFTITGDNSFEN